MPINETVYLGRDNAIKLALSVDGQPVSHNELTRCQVRFGATVIDSATSPALFDLTQASSIALKFGMAPLAPGRYQATLTVFDASHGNGVVWGDLAITVKSV